MQILRTQFRALMMTRLASASSLGLSVSITSMNFLGFLAFFSPRTSQSVIPDRIAPMVGEDHARARGQVLDGSPFELQCSNAKPEEFAGLRY